MAFREIVIRHADLVYASALRQARSPELARDIAPTVFTDLRRKAPALRQNSSGDSFLAPALAALECRTTVSGGGSAHLFPPRT